MPKQLGRESRTRGEPSLSPESGYPPDPAQSKAPAVIARKQKGLTVRAVASRPACSCLVGAALLLASLLLGPVIATLVSLVPRTPPPNDIAWWVLCASPRGAPDRYTAAHLVDWRRVTEGADTVTPFGSETPLPVGELEPIGDQEHYARVQDAIRELNEALYSGAWRSGPAFLDFELEGDRATVTLSLDDYGTYRTAYRASAYGQVSVIGATFSASGFGFTRDSPIMNGLWYGLLAGIALAVLWRVFAVMARRERAQRPGGGT